MFSLSASGAELPPVSHGLAPGSSSLRLHGPVAL